MDSMRIQREKKVYKIKKKSIRNPMNPNGPLLISSQRDRDGAAIGVNGKVKQSFSFR